MPGVKIFGYGACVPDQVVTNKQLSDSLNAAVTFLVRTGQVTEQSLVEEGILQEATGLSPDDLLGKLTTTKIGLLNVLGLNNGGLLQLELQPVI